jgi:hypothetical protein
MARPLVPGEVAGLAIVGAGLATSAMLAVHGLETISTCTRRSRLGRAVALYLCWHLWVESRHDPLGRLDRMVRQAVTAT